MTYVMPARVSYGAKVITAGVLLKAVLMGTLVSLLAVAGFEASLILVLVSACATGVFGILIVLIQTHSEKGLHERMERLEQTGSRIEAQAGEATAVAQTIADAVTPNNGEEGRK